MSTSNTASTPNNQPKDQANKDSMNPKTENAKTSEQGSKSADQATKTA